ncbi:MAG: 16S rRNA (guanine(527)-N(7))-methyltransferase RsmG [Steroidobacteraceae bacterium]|nr:16S rRNA (guanine(527)-N(7))-methyltransferase RsmG [Steroidobacteraceae bacterium]
MRESHSTDEEFAALAQGAALLGLSPSTTQLAMLLVLLDELTIANTQVNLTAIRDRPGMLRKHLLDSLSVAPFLSGERIADVGTGAGFPGLPLAIVHPERHFTLIESTGKKARYVARTAERLGLGNVEVVAQRAEHYRPPQGFDAVLARAVCALAALAENAGHLCAPGGRLLAMKGRRPDGEISSLGGGWRVLAVHRLHVPGLDEQRHLVEICRAKPRSSAA